jgi:RsiW-degrading membrane proteinase PrsW (M82 family)
MRFIRRQAQPSRSDERESSGASSSDDDRGLNYQSFPDNEESNQDFRGFSTSINDMFTNPENERVDCCALACCGILQHDRDRYLITGTEPPSCFRRFWLHIMLPCWIFGIAMFCAVNIPDPWLNEVLSTGFVFSLIGYFILQCLKGTWKKRELRKELLWSKYNRLPTGDFRHRTDEDSMDAESSDGAPAYFMGQARSDINNAHALCGCYATDRRADHRFRETDDINICTRFFQCFSTSCCGAMCGMHLQICGIFAVAQEARQLEALLHAGYRRIDYITMQPMMSYYPEIYRARHGEDEEPESRWWDRLSRFSKWVVGSCLGFLILLLVWSFFSLRFRQANYLVFCATLFQAYVLLSIVHWKHNRDISTDALIKLFASGFCLSTTIAVFFELVVGLTMRLFMSILMAMSGIDVVESNGYTLASPGFGNFWNAMQETGEGSPSYRDYIHVFGQDHPFIITIYLFINAFFLAATIEELSKYFGFRMVEHPDFLSRRDLQEAAECYTENDEEEDQEEHSFPEQDRSLQSRGAAITVAMVAVSLGFGCCENLVYIFVYGEATLAVEVVILLASDSGCIAEHRGLQARSGKAREDDARAYGFPRHFVSWTL